MTTLADLIQLVGNLGTSATYNQNQLQAKQAAYTQAVQSNQASGTTLRDYAQAWADQQAQKDYGIGPTNTSGSTGNVALDAMIKAGFRGNDLRTAYAIAMAESGLKPRAWNPNASTGDNSYGLFQINMLGKMGPERRRLYGLKSNEDLYDPYTNARVAYGLYKARGNFGDWTTYTTSNPKRSYRQYLGDYDRAVKASNTGQLSQNVQVGQPWHIPNTIAKDISNASLYGGNWSLPLSAPKMSSPFGMRFHPVYKRWKNHLGVDFSAPAGTPIKSIGTGRVIFSGWANNGYGNQTVVAYPGGYVVLYGHMIGDPRRIGVKPGAPIKAGQVVGQVGSTGISTGNHLHLMVTKNGQQINPALLFNRDFGHG